LKRGTCGASFGLENCGGLTAAKFLTGYFATTAILWLIVFFTERCWMWQNANQVSDIARHETCLQAWEFSSIALVLCQLSCLVMVAFVRRLELTRRWRIVLALFAVTILLTNSLVLVLLFMPRIH
jgi:hypothetical protein